MKTILVILVALLDSSTTTFASWLRASTSANDHTEVKEEAEVNHDLYVNRRLSTIDQKAVIRGFGLALETILLHGLSLHDPFPVDESQTFEFPNVDLSYYCGGARNAAMDASVELYIPNLQGLDTFVEYGWKIDHAKKKVRDFPNLPWAGTFNLTGTFADLISNLDMNVQSTSSHCNKRWDLSKNIDDVQVKLIHPGIKMHIALEGNYNLDTRTVTASHAQVQNMTFTYTGLNVQWSSATRVAPWVPRLMRWSMTQFLMEGLEDVVAPAVKEGLNENLLKELPMVMDSHGQPINA